MTNFYRRLLYYGLGFGIGLIFVLFFFNNRGCSWLPENRIKEMILNRIVYISDSNLSVLKSLNIQEGELTKYLTDAEVYFTKSSKQSSPKIYHIEGSTKTQENIVSQIVLYKDALTCELIPNQFSSQNTKPTVNGIGKPIHFPPNKNLFYSDSSLHTICQRNALAIKEDSTLSALFFKNGRINISDSEPEGKPKPIYAMVFTNLEKTKVRLWATYFKDKARIYRFEFIGDTCQ